MRSTQRATLNIAVQDTARGPRSYRNPLSSDYLGQPIVLHFASSAFARLCLGLRPHFSWTFGHFDRYFAPSEPLHMSPEHTPNSDFKVEYLDDSDVDDSDSEVTDCVVEFGDSNSESELSDSRVSDSENPRDSLTKWCDSGDMYGESSSDPSIQDLSTKMLRNVNEHDDGVDDDNKESCSHDADNDDTDDGSNDQPIEITALQLVLKTPCISVDRRVSETARTEAHLLVTSTGSVITGEKSNWTSRQDSSGTRTYISEAALMVSATNDYCSNLCLDLGRSDSQSPRQQSVVR